MNEQKVNLKIKSTSKPRKDIFMTFLLLLVVSISLVGAENSDGPYDQIPPYQYPFIDERHDGYGWFGWFGWGGSGGGGFQPALKLAFVVEPANRLYWKTETYDLYLGIPKNGVFWEKSDKSSVEIYSRKGKEGRQFSIYKKLDTGDFNFHLIKPPTKDSWIDVSSIEINPDSGRYNVNLTSYDDYFVSIHTKNRTILSYNTTYYSEEIDPSTIGKVSDLSGETREQYTQLPYKELPEEVKKVRDELYDPDLNIYDQSVLVKRYLLENIKYDPKWWENATPWRNEDVASWTLKNGKGICNHFASTYIVLERSMGIPARLAIGYAGGKNIKNRTYIFTSFAHGWVEVYMPPYGWVSVDPTGSYTVNQNQSNQSFLMDISLIPFNGDVRPDLQEMYEFHFDQWMQQQFPGWNNTFPFNTTFPFNQSFWNSSFWNQSLWNQSLWNQTWWNMSQWNTTWGNYTQWNETWWNYTSWNETTWNYTQWNQTFWNQTSWNQTVKNDSWWNKTTSDDMIKNLTKNPFSLIIDNINSNNLPFILLFLSMVFLLILVYKFISSRKKLIVEKIKPVRPREIRYIDIISVIERCKRYGREGRYLEGVIYAYIELASFLCLNLDIEKDQSRTPREFKFDISQIKDLDLDAITSVFERAKYAEKISEEEFNKFIQSLIKIAEEMKGREK